MTENNNSSQHQIQAVERQPSSMAALFPKVTFGLSAAVLAGVMVVTVPGVPDALGAQSATGAATQQVMTTAGLGAVINAVAGITPYETTCCGDKKPTLSLSFPSCLSRTAASGSSSTFRDSSSGIAVRGSVI